MKTRKYICLCLALLILTSFGLTACANGGEPSDHDTTGSSTLDNKETDLESETDEKNLLPEANQYDGHEFNFLTVSHTWQEYDQMFYEELTGDRVADAIYERNTLVNELLDIKIQEQYDSDEGVISRIRISVAAGDNAYDTAICSVAAAGSMYNANLIAVLDNTLDFEAPWWYQSFNDYVNINNNNNEKFIAYGRGNVMSYVGCFMVIGANTDLVPRYNLENPYTVYEEGRWTLDHMYANIQTVATDLNGNGSVTDYTEDLIGSVGAGNQFSLLLCCSGENLAVKQENTYVLKVSERFYDVYDKVVQVVTDEASCWLGVPGQEGEYYWTIFNEGRSLYMSNAVAAFKSAREGEIPYVLLPYPKADEGQKDYYNIISNYVGGMIIPASQNEEEMARTGMILEYLSAYSEPIYDAFVENTLYYKYAKDPESVVVFSSMLDNVPYYDLGFLYNWGNIRTDIDTAVAGKVPLASRIKTFEKAFNRAAKKSMKDDD